MAFKYRCSDCGKYFLSFLPSWKCPECQGKMYQCDYQVEVSAELEKSIKAKATKEFAEKIKDEITDAIISNGRVIEERENKYNANRYEDDLCIMCDSKIIALGGIKYFIDNLLKEMEREQ